jgi:hypothetical protein
VRRTLCLYAVCLSVFLPLVGILAGPRLAGGSEPIHNPFLDRTRELHASEPWQGAAQPHSGTHRTPTVSLTDMPNRPADPPAGQGGSAASDWRAERRWQLPPNRTVSPPTRREFPSTAQSQAERRGPDHSGQNRFTMLDGRLYMRPASAASETETAPPPHTTPRTDLATEKPGFFGRMPRLWPKRPDADQPQTVSPPQSAAASVPFAGERVAGVPPLGGRRPAGAATLTDQPSRGQHNSASEKRTLLDQMRDLRLPKWLAFGRSEADSNR